MSLPGMEKLLNKTRARQEEKMKERRERRKKSKQEGKSEEEMQAEEEEQEEEVKGADVLKDLEVGCDNFALHWTNWLLYLYSINDR